MTAAGRTRLIKPSRRLLALFDLYLRWYLRRHFHGLRVAHGERFPRKADGPLIIFLNHPSWWDPLTCIMISRRFLPRADHYAPMDEAALERYGFFSKLGLFPVEMNTNRGAMQFVRYSMQVLAAPGSVLWLTPEGRFTDPRAQPPVFMDGLASLLSRTPCVTLLPLAMEYVFWDERLPEILVSVGEAMCIRDGDKYGVSHWNRVLSEALGEAQQELEALAIARDELKFEVLLAGGAGTGFVYDLMQRIGSLARGERYAAEHGGLRRP
jgi:1-acyl-sn-glycerol-3-phosphate acyltransferase